MTTKTRSDVTWPVALAAGVPILLFHLGVGFVRLKAKRRRGVRRFRRTLVQGGMRPEHAKALAAEYEKLGRVREYLGGGLPRLPFRF